LKGVLVNKKTDQLRDRKLYLVLFYPLTIVVLIDSSFVTTERLYVEVATKDEANEGMAVADGHWLTGSSGWSYVHSIFQCRIVIVEE